VTAAAALGSSLAFAPAPSVHRHSFHSWTFQSGPSALTPALQLQPSHLYQTQLYSYKNKNDNEKDSGEERDSTSAFLSQVFGSSMPPFRDKSLQKQARKLADLRIDSKLIE
jgi:hypothetical protein